MVFVEHDEVPALRTALLARHVPVASAPRVQGAGGTASATSADGGFDTSSPLTNGFIEMSGVVLCEALSAANIKVVFVKSMGAKMPLEHFEQHFGDFILDEYRQEMSIASVRYLSPELPSSVRLFRARSLDLLPEDHLEDVDDEEFEPLEYGDERFVAINVPLFGQYGGAHGFVRLSSRVIRRQSGNGDPFTLRSAVLYSTDSHYVRAVYGVQRHLTQGTNGTMKEACKKLVAAIDHLLLNQATWRTFCGERIELTYSLCSRDGFFRLMHHVKESPISVSSVGERTHSHIAAVSLPFEFVIESARQARAWLVSDAVAIGHGRDSRRACDADVLRFLSLQAFVGTVIRGGYGTLALLNKFILFNPAASNRDITFARVRQETRLITDAEFQGVILRPVVGNDGEFFGGARDEPAPPTRRRARSDGANGARRAERPATVTASSLRRANANETARLLQIRANVAVPASDVDESLAQSVAHEVVAVASAATASRKNTFITRTDMTAGMNDAQQAHLVQQVLRAIQSGVILTSTGAHDGHIAVRTMRGHILASDVNVEALATKIVARCGLTWAREVRLAASARQKD